MPHACSRAVRVYYSVPACVRSADEGLLSMMIMQPESPDLFTPLDGVLSAVWLRPWRYATVVSVVS